MTRRARPARSRWRDARRGRHANDRRRHDPAHDDLVVAADDEATLDAASAHRGARPWSSARPPTSSSMASTTMVLPAPVSPVTAVRPGPRTSASSLDHPEVLDVEFAEHVRSTLPHPSQDFVSVGVVGVPFAFVVSADSVALFFEQVVSAAEWSAVAGHGAAVGFPADGVVGLAPFGFVVATGPGAAGGEQHHGFA